MKYKDTQNKVHEIQDGYQHLMAGWPNDYVEITEQEATDILAALVAAQPVTIPSMTPRQVRLILTSVGLRSQVEAAVAASDQNTKDTWEFSTSIERTNPLLIAMATSLGLTEAQLDQLFIDGSKL